MCIRDRPTARPPVSATVRTMLALFRLPGPRAASQPSRNMASMVPEDSALAAPLHKKARYSTGPEQNRYSISAASEKARPAIHTRLRPHRSPAMPLGSSSSMETTDCRAIPRESWARLKPRDKNTSVTTHRVKPLALSLIHI